MVRQVPLRPVKFSDLFVEFGSGSIARLPRHQNQGFELHYIEKGYLHWEIENRSYLVPPGSVFFTFPWEKHGSLHELEPGHFFHFAVFRLKNSNRRSHRVRLATAFGFPEREQNRIFNKLCSVSNRCFPASRDLAWTIMRLVKELHHPGPLSRTHVQALSQAAFCELFHMLGSTKVPQNLHSPAELRVLRLFDHLRHQCSQPWTLDSMAAACHLKRTQLEALIKKLGGDPPILLLNRFRVQYARRLLKTTDKSVTEIAFASGFDSSQYFARVFHKLTGFTPSGYRGQKGNLEIYDQRFLAALNRLQ
jgi:AraC family L-rhamnose operon regulatory protein RhaS